MQGGRGVAWAAIESVPTREYRTLAHLREQGRSAGTPLSARHRADPRAGQPYRRAMERRLRRGEGYAILAVFAVMLAILLWPSPIDAPIDGALRKVLHWIHVHGAPDWFDYDFVQFAANVLLFVPLGALISSMVTRTLWWVSGLFGLALSLLVEFIQATLISDRFATVGDVLANTSGAVLGGALVLFLGYHKSTNTTKGPKRE